MRLISNQEFTIGTIADNHYIKNIPLKIYGKQKNKIMKKVSRRRFINNLIGGTIGVGTFPLLSFSSKDNKYAKRKTFL
jgi:hypothetical protein